MLTAPGSVVCALDGTERSGELARVAAELADILEARLELAYVMGADEAGRVTDPDAWATLDGIADAIGAPGAARHLPGSGTPAHRLVALAEDRGAEMIVVGAAGSPGGAWDLLLADASCPVLVVPAGMELSVEPSRWRGRALVCGLDATTRSRGTLRRTVALAERIDGSVTLTVPGRGDVAADLENVASAGRAALLVVGARTEGPWGVAPVGSMLRRLLRIARRPVLVVPPPAVLPASAAAG